MAVPITCPHCSAEGQIPEATIGRSLRCPRCKQVFTPGRSTTQPPESKPATARRKPSSSATPLIVAGLAAALGVGGLLTALYVLNRPKEPPRADASPTRAITVVRQSPKAASKPSDPSSESTGEFTLLPPSESIKPLAKGALPPPRERPVSNDIPPEPAAGTASFAGKEQTVAGLVVTPATLPPARVAPQLLWHPDGGSFYYLEATTGTLRLLAFPTLKEERVLRIGQKTSRLSVCDRGLLVALPDAQEVWLLDASSLEVKARIGIAGVLDVACAVPLKSALAICKEAPPVVVDLADDTPRLANASVERDVMTTVPPNVGGFAFATFDAEGKKLYAIGSGEQILRYRVEGQAIFLEAASPKVGAKGRRAPLCVGPDGRVCAPGGLKADETAVFVGGRLDVPAFTLNFGPRMTAVAFGPDGSVYGQNGKFALIVADAKGVPTAEYAVVPGPTAPEVFQILVHPERTNLVLLTARGIFLVRPANDEKTKDSP